MLLRWHPDAALMRLMLKMANKRYGAYNHVGDQAWYMYTLLLFHPRMFYMQHLFILLRYPAAALCGRTAASQEKACPHRRQHNLCWHRSEGLLDLVEALQTVTQWQRGQCERNHKTGTCTATYSAGIL